jgi:hypothetical protein
MRGFWPRSEASAATLEGPAVISGGGGAARGGAARDYSVAGAAQTDPRYSRLPPAAAAKLRRLAGEQADLDSAIYELSQRRSGFVQAKQNAQRNLDSYQNFRGSRLPLHRGEPPGAHERERAIEAARRDLDSAIGELGDIDERIARLNARKSSLTTAVFAWLKDRVPPGPDLLEEHDTLAPPQLRKGETWPAAIGVIRQTITALRADLGETASAPLPSGLVKARLRSEITALAERGKPFVAPCIEAGRPLVFRSNPAPVSVASANGGALGTATVDDSVGLVCWLFRDVLVAKVEAEVDAAADDKHAMTPEQRVQRERDLAGQILAAERLEEAAIEAAAADGIELQRRGDADPRAMLQLAGTLPAPRT